MKRICLLVVLACCIIPVKGYSQDLTAAELIEHVGRAIERGSARDMARYFGQNADLYLPRAEGTFSKSQSEIILREFFSRNTPDVYTVMSQGNMGDGSVFVIGRLSTKEGRSYRSYFLIKRISQTYVLHHVQFDLQL
ncbi:MAG: DUF4783 domain-containing protein [Bacteroidales bacterium]|nr:DUF4783 domain-containing protein [Bacteroidales bacterium]